MIIYFSMFDPILLVSKYSSKSNLIKWTSDIYFECKCKFWSWLTPRVPRGKISIFHRISIIMFCILQQATLIVWEIENNDNILYCIFFSSNNSHYTRSFFCFHASDLRPISSWGKSPPWRGTRQDLARVCPCRPRQNVGQAPTHELSRSYLLEHFRFSQTEILSSGWPLLQAKTRKIW